MAETEQKKLYTFGEELTNAISHGVGTLLSIAALVLLILRAVERAPEGSTASYVVGFAIFGSTLILLYTMSTLYHSMLPRPVRFVFKMLDHSAIYLLIAGTYTAFCLSALRGPVGWTLFGLIWGLAAIGVTMDTVSACRLKWVSLTLYLCMGWLALIAFPSLLTALPPLSLKFLLFGGIAYTVGAIFFAIRKKWLHSIWHFFVLAGSVLHFFAVYFVV
ncbi:MAG: PAQR family membrane homeostasis protein TrhA [Thermoguttaceae bacterium]|jgi:hemolysin III